MFPFLAFRQLLVKLKKTKTSLLWLQDILVLHVDIALKLTKSALWLCLCA